MCAADQGRFWDYHDMLFANWIGENAGSYTDVRLVAFAKALNLNMTSFNQCFQANTHKTEIDQDYAAGQAKGVNGTPSLFVNGTIVAPGYIPTLDQIQAAVTAALPKP
jgi:protein-disulfide isomerase